MRRYKGDVYSDVPFAALRNFLYHFARQKCYVTAFSGKVSISDNG